jgi:putative membrane protein
MLRSIPKTTLAAMALLLATGAYAAPLSDKPGTAMAPNKDALFLRDAAEASALEIAASKLAQTRASGEAVKAFAAQMIRDHQAADEKMLQLARKLGIQLPASPPEVKKQELENLGKLSGSAFDSAYARQIGVDAHQEAVALFRKAADDAKDEGVKAFARQTLPTLNHHLEMARQMASQVTSQKP